MLTHFSKISQKQFKKSLSVAFDLLRSENPRTDKLAKLIVAIYNN